MTLLSVDLGMKAGLAWLGGDGRVLRCRTVHFPNRSTLKRALPAIFDELPDVTHVILEGGGPVADLWKRLAFKRGLALMQVCAEAWREDMLWLRERRSGQQAKVNAQALALKVLQWSNLSLTSPLADDAAEAVLCGLWGARHFGLIETYPDILHQGA